MGQGLAVMVHNDGSRVCVMGLMPCDCSHMAMLQQPYVRGLGREGGRGLCQGLRVGVNNGPRWPVWGLSWGWCHASAAMPQCWSAQTSSRHVGWMEGRPRLKPGFERQSSALQRWQRNQRLTTSACRGCMLSTFGQTATLGWPYIQRVLLCMVQGFWFRVHDSMQCSKRARATGKEWQAAVGLRGACHVPRR